MVVDKKYAQTVLVHALSRAHYEGKAEKVVAGEIGVTSDKLSKFKSGKLNIQNEALKKLIEIYGHPRVARGEYMEVELEENVESYIRSHKNRVAAHTRNYLEKFFASNALQKYMAESISDTTLKPAPSDNIFDFRVCRQCSKSDRPKVLQWFDERISRDPFLVWSENYENEVERLDYQNKRCRLSIDAKLENIKADDWDKTDFFEDDLPLVYLYGKLKNHLQSKFSFTKSMVTPGSQLREVVLTGEVILDRTILTTTLNRPNFLDVYAQAVKGVNVGESVENFYDEEKKLKEQIKQIPSFGIMKVEVKFYMNENLQYRVLLTEDWGEFKTQVVIKNVLQDRVLEKYNELCRFLGCEETQEKELKSAIAGKGGFLPGAELL